MQSSNFLSTYLHSFIPLTLELQKQALTHEPKTIHIGETSKSTKGFPACMLLRLYSKLVEMWNVVTDMQAHCEGVDVAALLGRVGLTVSGTSERVGTVAIAYAAHKALSPVRFPPTVALTPVVAKLLGKEAAKAE